jgi:hypothetical protein
LNDGLRILSFLFLSGIPDASVYFIVSSDGAGKKPPVGGFFP